MLQLNRSEPSPPHHLHLIDELWSLVTQTKNRCWTSCAIQRGAELCNELCNHCYEERKNKNDFVGFFHHEKWTTSEFGMHAQTDLVDLCKTHHNTRSFSLDTAENRPVKMGLVMQLQPTAPGVQLVARCGMESDMRTYLNSKKGYTKIADRKYVTTEVQWNVELWPIRERHDRD